MTNKDHQIDRLRADNGRLAQELQETRKAKLPQLADAPDTTKARAYIAELQQQVGALERLVADLRAISRPDSIEQWNSMAAEVTKANADRDAWKQIAVGTIGHVHTAVAKARAEAIQQRQRADRLREALSVALKAEVVAAAGAVFYVPRS